MDLYDTDIKIQYNIIHNTYMPCKTEGMTAFREARGSKQAGAMSLIHLTYNRL